MPETLTHGIKKFRIKNKIWIEPELFYSEAFMSLSALALRTLLRCLQKRKWVKVKVNGRKQNLYKNDGFILPYFEASYLKIGTTQHWKNIKILVERGFLDIVHQGGWYQKNESIRDYSVYLLSDRWKLYGTEDFKRIEKDKVLQPEFYIRTNLERQKNKSNFTTVKLIASQK